MKMIVAHIAIRIHHGNYARYLIKVLVQQNDPWVYFNFTNEC